MSEQPVYSSSNWMVFEMPSNGVFFCLLGTLWTCHATALIDWCNTKLRSNLRDFEPHQHHWQLLLVHETEGHPHIGSGFWAWQITNWDHELKHHKLASVYYTFCRASAQQSKTEPTHGTDMPFPANRTWAVRQVSFSSNFGLELISACFVVTGKQWEESASWGCR